MSNILSLLARRADMMGKHDSDNGLFAYWDEADEPTGSSATIWTDRINGLKLTMSTSTIRANNEYKISNGQKIILQDPIDSFIQYELMYEISYDVQLNDTAKTCYKIIDFGAVGTCKWNYGFMPQHIFSSGEVTINAKNSTNQVLAIQAVGNAGIYAKGDWLYNKVAKGGIRLLGNGKQQVWAAVDNSVEAVTNELTAYELHPLPVNGIGSLSSYGYFSLGSKGSAVDFNQNIIIHYIKLYSKSL